MFNKRFAAALLALATTTAAVGSPAVAAPIPGRFYQMQVVNSGLRLEVAFGSTGNGAPIIQGPSAPSYRPANWRFDPVGGAPGFYRIVNRNGGKCIDAGAPSVRLVIRQSTCGSDLNTFANWKLTPVAGPGPETYKITSRTSNLALCIIGDLTFSAVPLVSDVDNGVSCRQAIQLILVNN